MRTFRHGFITEFVGNIGDEIIEDLQAKAYARYGRGLRLDIKDELKMIFYLDSLIDSELRQLEELKSLKTTIKSFDYSLDKVKTSPSNKCFTGTVDRIVDLESKINSDIDELVARKERAIILFSHLDGDKRLLMSMRYLNKKSWQDVADSLFCSLRTVHYLHGVALNELRAILKS